MGRQIQNRERSDRVALNALNLAGHGSKNELNHVVDKCGTARYPRAFRISTHNKEELLTGGFEFTDFALITNTAVSPSSRTSVGSVYATRPGRYAPGSVLLDPLNRTNRH